MAEQQFDGRFYAEGMQVWKAPVRRESSVSLGFVVAQVNENLTDPEGVAQMIADAMNAAAAEDEAKKEPSNAD
jgi:hypothetical protein